MCEAVAQLLVLQLHKCLETRKVLCGQLVHVWKNTNLLMIHVGSECNLQLMSRKLATMSCSHTLVGFGKLFPRNHLLFYSFILRY